MPSIVASLLCLIGILGLILSDRDRQKPVSPALWIAVTWISLGASRTVSQWLGRGISITSAEQFLEGSPLDRLVIFGLLGVALVVLFSRGRRSSALLQENLPIVLFIAYCGLSALWSDFPFVTFKRWTKGLGNLVMVLIVLSDPNPSAAVKRLFARVGFLLLPLSVLFVKYYPQLGRGYDPWTGIPIYTGVATDKNMLGCLCLITGLSTLWLFIDAFKESSRRAQRVVVHGTMLGMAAWLFFKADSATSLACFLIGSSVILAFHSTTGRGRTTAVHLALGTSAVLVLVAYAFFDAQTNLLQALGRDATLTGRTELWETLIQMDVAPVFGTGFESFFLGERVDFLWEKYWWHPNEAHNGYLEIYLTLGWIGIGLFFVVVASGYVRIMNAFHREPRSASLRLAFWLIFLIYNMTEAAVKVMHPVWIAFLFAVIAVPNWQETEGTKPNNVIPTRFIPIKRRSQEFAGRFVGSSRTSVVNERFGESKWIQQRTADLCQ